jgi:tetratricopeptide (TPR) repeat protein
MARARPLQEEDALMGWVVILIFAAFVMLGLWRFGKMRRAALELLGAALLLGIAGYAWQGSPTLAGSPKPPPADEGASMGQIENLPEFRTASVGGVADILSAADGLIERGMVNYAVAIIRAGLSRNPQSADLWVGLGNALVVHGGGMMSPAAQLAFERAAKIAPDHPGPPFFMGLAYAQAGQVDRAEQIWRDLLARAPAGAPWRADLEQRLAEIAAARSQ